MQQAGRVFGVLHCRLQEGLPPICSSPQADRQASKPVSIVSDIHSSYSCPHPSVQLVSEPTARSPLARLMRWQADSHKHPSGSEATATKRVQE